MPSKKTSIQSRVYTWDGNLGPLISTFYYICIRNFHFVKGHALLNCKNINVNGQKCGRNRDFNESKWSVNKCKDFSIRKSRMECVTRWKKIILTHQCFDSILLYLIRHLLGNVLWIELRLLQTLFITRCKLFPIKNSSVKNM